jgi:hypothetical protein
MTLISEKNINNVKYKFYMGLDIDLISDHPDDGSEGFLIFFIESWEKEFNSHNRNLKIDSLLNDKRYKEFTSDDINKNYVSIYQIDGIGFEQVYNLVLDKIERTYNEPWIPVAGVRGAWKINNIEVKN